VIVRIMGEGQFEVPDAELDTLNGLDDRLETAVEDGDESAFGAAFGALLDKVRALGTPAAHDLLAESDVILPPADSALSDVAALLAEGAGDGLIPG
jgi:hypothetical protein